MPHDERRHRALVLKRLREQPAQEDQAGHAMELGASDLQWRNTDLEERFLSSMPYALISLYLGSKLPALGQPSGTTTRKAVREFDPAASPRRYAEVVLLNLMAAEIVLVVCSGAMLKIAISVLHALGIQTAGSHPVGAAVVATTMTWTVGALIGTHWNATNSWLVERQITRGDVSQKTISRSVPGDKWMYGATVLAASAGVAATLDQSHVAGSIWGVVAGIAAAVGVASLIVVGLRLVRTRVRRIEATL